MSSASWLPALLRLLERRTGLVLRERNATLLEGAFVRLAAERGQGFGEVLDNAARLGENGTYRASPPIGPVRLLEFLRTHPQDKKWAALLEAAVVPGAHFYRVLPQMLALQANILPELLSRTAGPPRLWSAGCSSGEEVYTLAFLLEECAVQLGLMTGVQNSSVLGTDLSPHALALARVGRYGTWSFRGTPLAWQSRYFRALEGNPITGPQWEVLGQVRNQVKFELYNLVEPPSGALLEQKGQYDLILCRNVTIYFRPEVAQAVYRHLASRLSPGGYLMLGPSDPPPIALEGLEQKSAPGALYWQKPLKPLKLEPLKKVKPPLPLTPKVVSPIPFRPSLPQPERTSPPSSKDVTSPLERGLERLERGDASGALEPLRQAAYLDSQDAFVHFTLGRVWLALGRVAQARAALLYAQSLLAVFPPETPLNSAPELTALDLRHALERLLLKV
ncbi:MAG: hypothetical protein H7095_02750 [Pseudopedobacter sp.]|nr:hypothetical protein [Deinococcales bacterium]